MELLKDRVAIITGGTGALGRAVNEHFLSHGAKVAVPYIIDAEVPLFHEKMGGRFPAGNIHLGKIDVGNEDQVTAFVGEVEKKLGRSIFNQPRRRLLGFQDRGGDYAGQWQAMFDINLKPTFLCCKAVVPVMQKNKYGRIVSVSSRTGLTGAGEFAAYAITKGAIKTFTASLAEEVLGDNVLVNAIAPSTIDTDANRKAMPKAKHENWVKPEDIARTLAFLSSEQDQVTSGAVVPVYGRA